MKNFAVALLLAVAAGAAVAAPPKDFAQHVESARQAVGVPGMAVAIVEGDAVTFARGFGVKALGGSDPVDADTIFPSGSTGKAFTVAALGILVDQGRISWDDKVTDRLPGFQMYDPWVTREMTIRDLLVHRSGLGLGAGDLLFVPRTNLTRAESVRRLRYIKPATSFRSGFAYDNVLYMVAGQLIEAVTGQTWEQFMAEQVLRPAGMLHSTADAPARFAQANRAQPHARMDGGFRGTGHQEMLDEHDELGRTAAPAGGLAVSANDFARWLSIQLHAGELPGHSGRLFSVAAHEQMWTPVVLQPIDPHPAPLKLTQPNFYTYALGWDVMDYRGTKVVWHSGAVFGFLTAVMLIPDRNVAFSIQINSEDGEIIRGLMYELLDHYLGLPRTDWVARYQAEKKRRVSEALNALKAQTAKPTPVGPSLPLKRYTGTFADPWYGNIEVTEADGALHIDFKSTPRMSGTLAHWQYDTFVTQLTDKSIEPAYVTFGLGAQGDIERVTMKAVSPLADFSYDYQDLLFAPVTKAP
ncbi:MAG TPA: serine hydrolase [Steroidobacteraceae bacterium]|jgi:CubicO group peptidase (beta-lactamase class C family)